MWKRLCLCLLALLCVMPAVAMAEGEPARVGYRDFEGAREIVPSTDGEGSALGPSECGLAGALVPRSGYICEYDFDGDGAVETVLLYKGQGADKYGNQQTTICLRVTRADGDVLADGKIYGYGEIDGYRAPEQRCRIYDLGGGRIYVNAQYSFEGTSNNYEIFRMEQGSLIEEINLCDPDWSEECYLYDENTSEGVYYSENFADRVGTEYMNVLNQRFAAYGVTFAEDGYFAYAVLPDSWLICDVEATQLDASIPTPNENASVAETDAGEGVATQWHFEGVGDGGMG